MDSASSPQYSNKMSYSSSKSHFKKTVCLKDWWLEKPENNSKDSPLAIAGITSREKRAVRVFSAPIWKRRDVTVLETIDGVFVIMKGFMNKARTEANGFSSEICKHFVFGFPSDWEILAKRCYVGEIRLSSVSEISQSLEPLSPLHDSIIKSPQKDCPLSPCHVTKKPVPKMPVSVAEDVNRTESCKKSLTENFLKLSAVVEVENHGQMHRELTDSFSNVNMSNDYEIMPKSDSVNGDNAITNAESVPAHRSRGRPALKKTVPAHRSRGRPALKKTVDNGDSRTCNKSITENFLKSPAVMEVENHGQIHRELTDSFGNDNISKDDEIMPKSGSVNGDNAISNAESIPAHKSSGRPAFKKWLTDNILKSPAVMEVENHGQIQRELTDSFANDNMSKDEEIMPKSGSMNGDNAISNAEAVPAHKSRGQPKKTVNNDDLRTRKKLLTENILKSPIVMEVGNHGQIHRELTDSFGGNDNISKDEELMSKSGSMNGDNAISNAEAIPAHKSRGRPALKKTVNNDDTRTIKKSLTDNILKSPAVMEVENHGQVHRESTDSFLNDNISKDEEIMSKSGSKSGPVNGDNAIANAEAVPAHKSRGLPKKTINNDDTRTCTKSLTENILKSPAVMVVENHGQVHRELTDSFSNDNMSKNEEIRPKPGSANRDNAIANVEAVPAHNTRGRPALKKNNDDSRTVTPCNSHSRGCLSSSKKKEKAGGIKQSNSQSATPRPGKPVNNLAYETSALHKRKDKPSGISPLSSAKRSRSGRLLLPKLEFWRNQIAFYDMDRQITAVKDLNLDALSEGRKK